MEYLSKEKQFDRILNNEEIRRIEDPELQRIRHKYWVLQHDAFCDERGISDSQIGKVSDELREKEMAELEEYKKRKGYL